MQLSLKKETGISLFVDTISIKRHEKLYPLKTRCLPNSITTQNIFHFCFRPP